MFRASNAIIPTAALSVCRPHLLRGRPVFNVSNRQGQMMVTRRVENLLCKDNG